MDPNNTNNPVGNPQPVPPVFPVNPVAPVVPNIPNSGIENVAPQNFNNVPVPEKPKHKIWKWIGIAVGIFVVIGVLIFVLIFTITAAPVKIANEQFNDIRQNNIQAAYDLFTDAAKGEFSFSDFQTIVSNNHLSDAQTASISFSRTQVNDNKAELDGQIKVNATSAGLRYLLVEENGVWKVDAFSIIPQ